MLERLQAHHIKIGVWILRNDVVRSAWLEDRINSQEKLQSFTKSWNECSDKSLFQIIL